MPNHYTTVGIFGRDWKRGEALGIEDVYEINMDALKNANLCEIVKPMPECLRGIVSSNEPTIYVNKQTGEVLRDGVNGPEKDFELYDRRPLTRLEQSDLIAKCGASSWFDWCPENWGTKWGTYDTDVIELPGDGSPVAIVFSSAWHAPNAHTMALITKYICETYCLKNAKWSFSKTEGLSNG